MWQTLVFNLCTNIIIANLRDAPTENRIWVSIVVGYYSATRPLVLLTLGISITYSYFGHAVLPKPLTFRFTTQTEVFKLCTNIIIAPAENRSRVRTVAGYYSTTRPLVLLTLGIYITTRTCIFALVF